MKFKKSLLLGILGIIAIYAIILIAFDVNIISEKINDFDFQYLPFIIPLIPLTWGVLFLRWNLLLKNSAIDIPLKDNFMIFISGFALGVTPGKVGELIKAQLLKNKLITVKASQNVIRLYPALVIAKNQIDEGIEILEKTCKEHKG